VVEFSTDFCFVPSLSVASTRIEHMFDVLMQAGDHVAGLLETLDPDRLTGVRARELWGAFDRIERLAAAGKTLLARRVAATHSRSGATERTAAEELARRSGTSTKNARDAVETSTRLREQPKVDAALRRGELSSAQADLISGAAAANPNEEPRLLELAQHASLPELRDECQRVKAAADPDPEATHRRIHQNRCLRRYTDAEGAWNLHARGTAECGAAFNTVLDPIIDAIFGTARREGRREPAEAYAFDALITMADRAAGHDSGGTRTDSADADRPDATDGAADSEGAAVTMPASDRMADPMAANADSADLHSGGGDVDTAAGDLEPAGTDRECPPADVDSVGTDTGRIPTGFDYAADLASSGGDLCFGPEDRDGRGDFDSAAHLYSPESPSKPSPGDHERAIARAVDQREHGEPRVQNGRSRPRPNPRYLALLRIDVDALRRGAVQGQELCEITGVGPIPVPVARDLLGDAIIKLIITRGVDVLNVTHLGRGPTAAQRAALLWANPACSVQGCNRTRIEFDHRDPWADTHHTRLDELDPLCKFHHDQKTHLSYALIPGKGKRRFVPPHDPRHPLHQKAPPAKRRTGGYAADPSATRRE
jgi:hypothetical protein